MSSRRCSLLCLLLVAGLAHAQSAPEILVDPTRPLGAGAGDAAAGDPAPALEALLQRYEVSSILVRPDLRLAVINSRFVKVGERVDDALVTAIESDSVTLDVNGETRVLKVHKRSIKSPAEAEG